jgi:serine/threonine protein kinase/Flp pilus assembly protein TadD
MAERWRAGDCPLVEHILARHPDLRDQPEVAVRLIYEEICLRQEAGQEGASVQVLARFPQWHDQLEVLLDCHRLLESGSRMPQFPEVGEALDDFHLVAELGRGGQGRVFLATQPSLADRPVVLKLTPCDGQEHLSLARLQHTHIVPLYSVQVDATRKLRMLCLPYFGGATLATILKALQDKPLSQRTGRDLLDVVDRVQAALDDAGRRWATSVVWATSPTPGPTRQIVGRATYLQALCGLGICLAEALHYAHERGLVHLDLKPSNVLLASDGQPMLLDFHLAQEPIRPDGPLPVWLGGTPTYMSPEQQAAVTAVREGQPIPRAVDGRSDIYSLGLLLYEALGGGLPEKSSSRPTFPPLRSCNPDVSVGLSDLIGKCLAPDPRDRYPDAAALAADLRHHLANLPLRHVANRSLVERARKWWSRRRHGLLWSGRLMAVLVVALAVGATLMYVRRLREEATTALADGQHRLANQDYAAAARSLEHGLGLLANLPGNQDLRAALSDGLDLARRAQAADSLHRVVDRLRFLLGVDALPGPPLRTLERDCRTVWELRHFITHQAGGATWATSGGAELQDAREKQIRTDLIDLAILWSELRVRLAAPLGDVEVQEARQEALRVLAEAEEWFGPNHVLCREQQNYAESLGAHDLARAAAWRAQKFPPQLAWEHYAVGRSLLRSGQLVEAAAAFARAQDLQPQDFWPHFYQGVCSYRLQRYREAVNAFTVCVALAPQVAECYYNRALAESALGNTDRALHDYDQALRLQPALAEAALNRGILHYQQKRYTQAINDLLLARQQGARRDEVHYHLALVYLSQKNKSAALENLRLALRENPDHQKATQLLKRIQGER